MLTSAPLKKCSREKDFLVISGDAACDFDLKSFSREHFLSGADVSVALYPHAEPLEYGTVVTDNEGNIINFIEKPPWERVVTDLVNTGIYMISPKVLELIPKNHPFDFARDLFPILMERGFKLHGSVQKGYWCDIGNPKSYHKCCMDALDGKLKLKSSAANELSDSILSLNSLLCRDISLGKNCEFMRSVIHPGSFIGENSKIIDSVVDNATIGKNCVIEGAVICEGAVIPDGTFVCKGAVVSSNPAPASSLTLSSSPKKRRCQGLVQEFSCKSRARLMREMSSYLIESGADFSDGISLNEGNCKVRISPMADDCALTIEADGGREADRLSACQKYASLAKQLELYSNIQ